MVMSEVIFKIGRDRVFDRSQCSRARKPQQFVLGSVQKREIKHNTDRQVVKDRTSGTSIKEIHGFQI
jgi:hypothetical protein